VTSENGAYLMPALTLGSYQVKVELSGFATVLREGLSVGVGDSLVINFSLKLASLSETLTVVGKSPLVETRQSDLASKVEPRQIETLPLSGRNWLELVGLVPGARGNPGQIGAGAAGGDASRYQMDGLSVTGQGTGGETQTYSHETIAQFQVVTNRADAEYGRVTGAVINAVSKSGTNQLRGSALYFVRNDRFDAANFFTGVVAPFDEKQSGFTVGGPIIKNRAHFFGAYEFQKRNVTARPNTGIAQFDQDVDAGIRRKLPSARADIQLTNMHRMFARANLYYLNTQNQGWCARSITSTSRRACSTSAPADARADAIRTCVTAIASGSTAPDSRSSRRRMRITRYRFHPTASTSSTRTRARMCRRSRSSGGPRMGAS
jgi:hypothetical protein